MAKSPEAAMIIMMRKTILKNLSMFYPSGLTMNMLFQTVFAIDETYDESLLKKDVIYLKEKGYLVFTDDVIGGMNKFMRKVAKLTPQGMEIAQDTQDDPALEL